MRLDDNAYWAEYVKAHPAAPTLGHERKTTMTKTQRNRTWREFALSRTYPSHRVLWGDGSETSVPEIPAYREADNVHLTFFCSECFHWHRHGAGQFTGDGDGHRRSHCSCPLRVGPDGTLRSKPESTFAETGYWLREVGLFTAAVAAQFPKDICRSPLKKQFWAEGSAWPIPAGARVTAARDRILAAFDEALREEDPDLFIDREGTLAIPSRDLYTAAKSAGSGEGDVTSALTLLTERDSILTPEWHEGRFCYSARPSPIFPEPATLPISPG